MKSLQSIRWYAATILIIMSLVITGTFDGVLSKSKAAVDFVFTDVSMHVKYPEISVDTTILQHKRHTSEIRIPVFDDAAIDRQFDLLTSMMHEHFVQRVNKRAISQDGSARLMIDFDIHRINKTFYSVILHCRSFISRSESESIHHVFLIDMEKKQFTNQNQILQHDEASQIQITQTIIDALIKSNSMNESLSFEQYHHRVYGDLGVPTSMYLNEKGFVFILNNKSKSSVFDDWIEVKIPFAALKDQTDPAWKDMLIKPAPSGGVIPGGDLPPLPPWNGPMRIALTFDDGPHRTNTPMLLNILEKYNAKATFFMVGAQVARNPNIARMVAEAGHEVANHSYTHAYMTSLSSYEIVQEIDRTNAIIQQATGVTPTLFRPPYGAINDRVRQHISLKVVMWTVDPQDWKYRDAQRVSRHVISHARDGSIVVMHDLHRSSVEAVELILQYMTRYDVTFMTVSEMYGK